MVLYIGTLAIGFVGLAIGADRFVEFKGVKSQFDVY